MKCGSFTIIAFHYHKLLYFMSELTFSLKIFTLLLIVRGSLNKFPDFFRMGTFIDGTHMEL